MNEILSFIIIVIVNISGIAFTYRRKKKSDYINSVSLARREWLENVREAFVASYLDLSEKENEKYIHKINLLLNPSDKYVKLLTEIQFALDCYSKETDPQFASEAVNNNVLLPKIRREKIIHLYEEYEATQLYHLKSLVQQIILKKEWHVIKEEIEKGKELEDQTEQTNKAVEAVDEDHKVRNTLTELNELADKVNEEQSE